MTPCPAVISLRPGRPRRSAHVVGVPCRRSVRDHRAGLLVWGASRLGSGVPGGRRAISSAHLQPLVCRAGDVACEESSGRTDWKAGGRDGPVIGCGLPAGGVAAWCGRCGGVPTRRATRPGGRRSSAGRPGGGVAAVAARIAAPWTHQGAWARTGMSARSAGYTDDSALAGLRAMEVPPSGCAVGPSTLECLLILRKREEPVPARWQHQSRPRWEDRGHRPGGLVRGAGRGWPRRTAPGATGGR